MANSVFLNDTKIMVRDFQQTTVNGRRQISFLFQVEHKDYHDITTLLYKNDFDVKVPEEKLSFRASISNYSTSVTNLYEENAVGDFYLELTEKE
ncbi:Protein of unknown function [Fictibacillus solisalsi]|uniref:DUF3219 domain-containing protein n=1 Tax=Fictibacillus solisalsi TaxID=459525 RepID=A0A1G9XA09_9BACL|nr:DUF3219 family protein [Fictibacillus solisalsi]SDM93574.1 Protein of unknown function [Fictibacillus solisalsi]